MKNILRHIKKRQWDYLINDFYWGIYTIRKAIRNFILSLFGYEWVNENPDLNLPKIGEICLIKNTLFHTLEVIFKEAPLDERMNEKDFRWFFETIDGSRINLYGGYMVKKKGYLSYEFDPRNPKNVNT